MDTHFITQLALSILFLAPGVVLLVGLAFVGALMLVEKAMQHADPLALATPAQATDFVATSNPAPGRIVNALKASMREANTQQRKRNH